MKTAKQMYNFSKKYTPINTEDNTLHKTLPEDSMSSLLTKAFNVIISDLEKNEIVNFSFSASECYIYEGSKYTMGLQPVAIAITDYRIILCGYNKFKLYQQHELEHKIISFQINECVNPYYELFPAAAHIYFNEEIEVDIPFYTYDKQINGTELFTNLIADLQKLLNVEFVTKEEHDNKFSNRVKNFFELEPYHIGLLIIVVSCIAFIIYIISSLNNSTSVWDKEYDTCIICGGEMQCGMCGASGPYCENAQYGAGNDHFCLEHWADCCEWHEEQKNKR